MNSNYNSKTDTIIDTIDDFMRAKRISYEDLTKCKVIDLIKHDVSNFVGKTFIEPEIKIDRYGRRIRVYKIYGKLICTSEKCFKQCSLKRPPKLRLYFLDETNKNKFKNICFNLNQTLIFYENEDDDEDDHDYDERHDDRDDRDEDDEDDEYKGYEAGDERYPRFRRDSYRTSTRYVGRRGGKTNTCKRNNKKKTTRSIRKIKKTRRNR
jgi:hypothetical protein